MTVLERSLVGMLHRKSSKAKKKKFLGKRRLGALKDKKGSQAGEGSQGSV